MKARWHVGLMPRGGLSCDQKCIKDTIKLEKASLKASFYSPNHNLTLFSYPVFMFLLRWAECFCSYLRASAAARCRTNGGYSCRGLLCSSAPSVHPPLSSVEKATEEPRNHLRRICLNTRSRWRGQKTLNIWAVMPNTPTRAPASIHPSPEPA